MTRDLATLRALELQSTMPRVGDDDYADGYTQALRDLLIVLAADGAFEDGRNMADRLGVSVDEVAAVLSRVRRA